MPRNTRPSSAVNRESRATKNAARITRLPNPVMIVVQRVAMSLSGLAKILLRMAAPAPDAMTQRPWMTPLAFAMTCHLLWTLRVPSVLISRLPTMPPEVSTLMRIAFGVTTMRVTMPTVAQSLLKVGVRT